jgi:hypothetical protein
MMRLARTRPVYEPGVFSLTPTDGTLHQERLHRDRVLSIRTRAPCPETICGILPPKTIRMSRVPDHFIFTVESVGMYSYCLGGRVLRILQQSVRSWT